MNILRSLSSKILTGCAPAKNSTSQPTGAINKIRKSLEVPKLSLEFVENTEMANSPSGRLEVANYWDSEGRIYSVNPKTNLVVEIDARAVLSNISPDKPSMSSDDIKAKAILFAKTVIRNFDSLQSSLQEEGGREDNFFTWYGESSSDSMNHPFLQFAFHKSGVLFEYYNTLSIEK